LEKSLPALKEVKMDKYTAVLAIVAISIAYIAMANGVIKLIGNFVNYIFGG